MKASLLSLAVVCLVLIPFGSAPRAGWIENGVLMSVEPGNQRYPAIIPDGSGGCYVAWADSRFGSSRIFVQRLDRSGNELWTPGGVQACLYVSTQQIPEMESDGSGNIIVVWRDARAGYLIYAQKMDDAGNRLWDVNGIPVSTYSEAQGSIDMCSDDAGGVIVTWDDNRGADFDIKAQRIRYDGVQAWDGEDEDIDVSTGMQYYPRIVPDGNGGAIITWIDYNGVIIKAQQINANGSVQWTLNGEVVCGHAFSLYYPEIASDGAGGAIIAWQDGRGVDEDIYAQRVKYDGTMLWTSDGELICSAAEDQLLCGIVSDGAWGAVIVWEDYRNPSLDYDIYAQSIDGWGSTQWTADGIAIYTGNGEQVDARIVTDGDGGYYVAWLDMRSAVDYDIYAKRINQAGLSLWSSSMGEVCTAIYRQISHEICHDGEGNLLICWQDERNGTDADVYTQRIERNGYWGDPAPSIASVRDIPGDQGGWVNIAFDASRLDIWPEDLISSYSIWRAIDEQQAMLMLSGGAPLLSSAGELDPGSQGSPGAETMARDALGTEILTKGVLRAEILAGETYYWSQVGLVTASDFFDEYSEQVQTLFDSTSVSAEYQYFQVIAHGSGAEAFWISEPDSGRSVDNLAPCPPLALAGEQIFDPEGLQLTWSPNTEADLDYYVVHRGLSENFLPGRFSLLGSVCDTLLFDDGWDWSAGYWYKVAAVDIHGNESGYAVFGPDMVTGDEPMPLPDATFLSQNFPNPFNPNTSIAFGIKERGFVSLRIYDAAGRLISTLIDESMPAGRYSAEWNGRDSSGSTVASGVYFYRLNAKEFEETRKMILLR